MLDMSIKSFPRFSIRIGFVLSTALNWVYLFLQEHSYSVITLDNFTKLILISFSGRNTFNLIKWSILFELEWPFFSTVFSISKFIQLTATLFLECPSAHLLDFYTLFKSPFQTPNWLTQKKQQRCINFFMSQYRIA